MLGIGERGSGDLADTKTQSHVALGLGLSGVAFPEPDGLTPASVGRQASPARVGAAGALHRTRKSPEVGEVDLGARELAVGATAR